MLISALSASQDKKIYQGTFPGIFSGGIQEETTYLGIPCLTLRPNTERPITVTEGTNRLCTSEDVVSQAAAAMAKKDKPNPPLLWDGKTAGRVVESARRLVIS